MHLYHASQRNSRKLLVKLLECSFYSVDHEAIASNGINADAMKVHIPLLVEDHPHRYPLGFELLGSFNGLASIVIRYGRFYTDNQNKRFHNNLADTNILLWNPSTRESKLLPDPNPSIDTCHLLGFAYDSDLDDYKIVRIIYCKSFYRKTSHKYIPCRVDMYTLKSNSWKIIEDSPHNVYRVYGARQARGFAVNGFIYWLSYSYFGHFDDGTNGMIVGFGLKDEKFIELPLPHDIVQGYRSTDLRVLGGSLSIFQFIYNDKLVVWTMKEDKNQEWVRLMNVCISSPDYAFLSVWPVCFTKNRKLLLTFYYGEQLQSCSRIQKKFVLYDPERNIQEDFHVLGISDSSSFEEVTYIESLVSPNFSEEW